MNMDRYPEGCNIRAAWFAQISALMDEILHCKSDEVPKKMEIYKSLDTVLHLFREEWIRFEEIYDDK